jgi:dihydrofolate reductase
MRKLIYGMNLTLDGYVAAPGDDLGWSGPSDELFQWWLDQERAIGLLLYGRKLWEAMSSYWPTGDQQPNATPAKIEFARNWRDTPKVVFSSAMEKVDWNTRLVTGDAVAEITRLKAKDGEPMPPKLLSRSASEALSRSWPDGAPLAPRAERATCSLVHCRAGGLRDGVWRRGLSRPSARYRRVGAQANPRRIARRRRPPMARRGADES